MSEPNESSGQDQGQAASKGTQYDDKGEGWVSGNLTRDAELRYTPEGRAVCSLRVAETQRTRDENTGAWSDGQTTFYDVTAWGTLAENTAECLAKGDRIAAVGRWQRQTWTDPQGEQRAKTVLVARDLGPSLLFRQAKITAANRPRYES